MGGREKLNVGELRITGHDSVKVGTPTVKVLVRDAAGNVALSTGQLSPPMRMPGIPLALSL